MKRHAGKLILFFAVIVRIVAALDARDAPFWRIPILDEQAYVDLAHGLLAHTPLAHGAWYVAPGYAYFLALVFLLGGGLVAAKLVNLAAGTLCAWLVYRLTRRVTNEPAALLSGIIWALYPAALLQELLLLKTAITLLALLTGLAVLLSSWSPTRRGWVVSGVCFGLATLLRGECLVLACVVAGAGLWAHERSWPGAPRRSAPLGFLVVVALAVAIPTVQNKRWSGDTVFVAFGGGTNFYIGNHKGADGSYLPLRPDRFEPAQEEADAVALASRALGHTATPSVVSRYWFNAGLQWWRQAPAAAMALTGRKLALLWGPYELADAYSTPLASRWVWLLRPSVLGPWLILPAALVGLWITRRRRELWPLHAFVAGAVLAILPFFVFERFRLHLIAVCVPFAAAALEAAVQRARTHRFRHLAAGCIATAAVGLALAGARPQRDAAVLRVNLGEMLFQSGQFEAAKREFETVRRESPDAWRVWINIANVEVALGHPDAALAAFDSVLVHLTAEGARTGLPSAEELLYCHEWAGDLERERGQLGRAVMHYEAALPFAPEAAKTALRDKLAACRVEDPWIPPAPER